MEKMWKVLYVLVFVVSIWFGLASNREYEYELIVEELATVSEAEEFVKVLPALGEKININTESKAELVKLPGIGDKFAGRIIKYREENGDFEVIEDILKVPGIGEKKFEAMKNYIKVE